MQYFIKFLIKFLPRNVRLVRPPPDIVEVDQRRPVRAASFLEKVLLPLPEQPRTRILLPVNFSIKEIPF